MCAHTTQAFTYMRFIPHSCETAAVSKYALQVKMYTLLTIISNKTRLSLTMHHQIYSDSFMNIDK